MATIHSACARRLGIIGGGASGLLVAAAALREATSPVAITIYEPRETLGQGVAYSTTDRMHLLNVPACGMSAIPEDPDHFRHWAGCEDTDFVSRAAYGRYLVSVLDEARAQAIEGSTLTHARDLVSSIGMSPRPWIVTCSGGFAEMDAIVVATGHDLPAVPRALAEANLAEGALVADPWADAALDGVAANDTVLVVGTGLTFVDVSMSLVSRVPGVRVVGLSRHGLLPQAHEDPWQPRHPAPDWDLDDVDLRTILSYLKGFGADWRRGLDSLRPLTPALWQGFDERDRSVLVGQLSRLWDVHRHRMAPAVARIFARVTDAGIVRVAEGTISEARMQEGRVLVSLADGQELLVDRVVMCTGPSGDPRGNPLGRLMITRGLAQPGPIDAGFLVDPDTGALIGEDGHPVDGLYAVGPLRRGVLWESTAIPEIRVQAVELARELLQRQPVTA